VSGPTAAAAAVVVALLLLCSNKDRVRLVMLYALRFEGDSSRVQALLDFLVQSGVRQSSPVLFAAAEGVLQYAGADRCARLHHAVRPLVTGPEEPGQHACVVRVFVVMCCTVFVVLSALGAVPDRE